MYSWGNTTDSIVSTYTFLYLYYMVHNLYKNIKVYCY